MIVPFIDLKAQHASIREELLRVVVEVIDSGSYSGGLFVERFEEDFAEYCGAGHAIGVASGTEALWLALVAMGIGAGDEVITVPMSFIATSEAISRAGAKPVFVDIDPFTYTLNPDLLKAALTKRTKAILPVHLFGQAADMAPILDFAKEHDLKVIEDAAQAHGAEYGGCKVGTLGDAGCFSFYPGKNLGALGEAGAVVTDDEALARRIRTLRNHGQSSKNHHTELGWNSRMDGIQGAVLSLKLKQLDSRNLRRQKIAARYTSEFSKMDGIAPPAVGNARNHIYHIYAVRTRERTHVMRSLEAAGVGYGLHYPLPIHLQPAYSMLGLQRGVCPEAEKCADSFLSLPIYPELKRSQIDLVTSTVSAAIGRPLCT
jgi:dTDP-4-amino-4,6-dideoxygalactose transaminase